MLTHIIRLAVAMTIIHGGNTVIASGSGTGAHRQMPPRLIVPIKDVNRNRPPAPVIDATPPNPQVHKTLLYNWVPETIPQESLDAIGAKWYVKIHANVLPDDGAAGVVDPDDILAVLDRKINSDFDGYGMFSFEAGFWKNLHKGPGHPDYDRTVESMINLIRVVKNRYPRAKWSYWGLPHVPYWVPKDGGGSTNWNSVGESKRKQVMHEAVAIYQPIANEVDWLSPWSYDENEHALAAGKSWEQSQSEAQQNWMKAKVEVARKVLENRPAGDIPIIPSVSTNFAAGGNATTPGWIPIEELQSETIDALIESDVDGIAFWTPNGGRIQQAFRTPANDHQAGIRDKQQRYFDELFFSGQETDWDDPSMRSRIMEILHERILVNLKAMRKSLKSLALKSEAVVISQRNRKQSEPALMERSPGVRPKHSFKRRGIRVYSVRNRIRER